MQAELLLLPVFVPPCWIRDDPIVGDVRRCAERARHGRKPLIQIWNRVSMLYVSEVITTSGFRATMLNSRWPDCRRCVAMTSFWRHLCKSGGRFHSGHFLCDRSIPYRFWDIRICIFPLAPYRCWSGVDGATVVTSLVKGEGHLDERRMSSNVVLEVCAGMPIWRSNCITLAMLSASAMQCIQVRYTSGSNDSSIYRNGGRNFGNFSRGNPWTDFGKNTLTQV